MRAAVASTSPARFRGEVGRAGGVDGGAAGVRAGSPPARASRAYVADPDLGADRAVPPFTPDDLTRALNADRRERLAGILNEDGNIDAALTAALGMLVDLEVRSARALTKET